MLFQEDPYTALNWYENCININCEEKVKGLAIIQ